VTFCILAGLGMVVAGGPTAAVGVLTGDEIRVTRLKVVERQASLNYRTAEIAGSEPPVDSAAELSGFAVNEWDERYPMCCASRRGISWALYSGSMVIYGGAYRPSFNLERVTFAARKPNPGPVDVEEAPQSPALRDLGEFTKVHRGFGDLCVNGSGAGLDALITLQAAGGSGAGDVRRNVNLCLVPIDDVSCLVYVVSRGSEKVAHGWPKHEQPTLFVVECRIKDTTANTDEPTFPSKEQWECTRRILHMTAIDVVEPFEVVRQRDRDVLFFAHAGAYVVDWKTNKARSLPLRGGELVQAVVQDDDRGRAFAFTTKYWFEVKEPLEYHEFELDPPKPDDPLPTLVRAAREVRRVFPVAPGKSD
jgi:hypothetical protein